MMRLVLPLLLVLLGVLLVGFLINNPEQRVDLTLGGTRYTDVPLTLVVLVSLTLGVGLTAIVALIEGASIRLVNRRQRREIRRLEAETNLLRTEGALHARREPDALDAERAPGRSPAAAAPGPTLDELPRAPVYDPDSVDPALQGD
jgi:uncharacterized integral membrane protein